MLLSEELKAAGIAVVLLQTEAGLNMEGPAASLDVDSDGALTKAPPAPPRLPGSSHLARITERHSARPSSLLAARS